MMKRSITWTLLILAVLPAYLSGQITDKKDFNKKMKSANALLDFGDYPNALKIYQELYPQDSTNSLLSYKIGVSMYNLKKYKSGSLRYFEKSKVQVPESYFYLGNLYHLDYRFDEAIESFSKFSNTHDLKPEVSDSVLNHLKENSAYAKKMMLNKSNITIENLGKGINSIYPDYVPLISADESMLIFTSRRSNSTGGLLDPYGEYFEDIYISRKESGAWTTPQSISNHLNGNGHDACVALSPDGQNLIVFKTSEDLLAGDLYLSTFNGADWTIPEKLGSDINTEEGIEPSASFSADNNALYFSSNREGGQGGKDIYRVVKLPDGTWSKASSLGNVINSAHDEDAPFIHPDGKTLYFSSRGHQNMGAYDIFRSKFDDETGTWSAPENLGYPVNTVDNDIYFVLSANGKTGYYSSNKPQGLGYTDLYKINMPESNFNVAAFSGQVLGENNEPVHAKITVRAEGTQEVIAVYRTNKLTGKFIMILSPIGNYTFTIEAPGYQEKSGKVDFTKEIFAEKLKKFQNN